jgi:hypothetical protein
MAVLMMLAIVVAACVPHPPPREKFEPEPDFWWREA